MDTETLSKGSAPLISVVILNWNGADDTLACLDSLATLTYPNFTVLLVDNGSTDDSLQRVLANNWAFSLYIIENGANLGFAEGNNVGIRAALESGADFVMLLNNDTEIAPDCLDRLMDVAAAYPEAGVLGPRIFYMDPPDVAWFDRAVWNPASLCFDFPGQGEKESALSADPAETEYVCGAAMLFRAEVAKKIGLLDSRFFLVYEESDWGFAARRAGYKCLTVPAAKVWHKIGASFGSEESPLRAYFSARNHLLWVEKNRGKDELLRDVRNVLTSLSPHLGLSPETAPLHKRLVWGLREFACNWQRLAANPHAQARRRGLRDYLLRRFGDCPDEIRALSTAWARSRG
jgi:GT2 family glycosyltransferase